MRRKKKPLGQVNLKKAIAAVNSGQKSHSQASEEFGVSVSVLLSKADVCINPKTSPIEQNNKVSSVVVNGPLVNSLKARTHVDGAEFRKMLYDYTTISNVHNPYRVRGSEIHSQCNSDLSKICANSVFEKKGKVCNDLPDEGMRKINVFYRHLNDVVVINAIQNKFVFTVDTCGFDTDVSNFNVSGDTTKQSNRISGGVGRGPINVLACISADGCYSPPFIVFKGTEVQSCWVSEKSYPGTTHGVSPNGRMNETLFYNWFNTSFVNSIERLRLVYGTESAALLVCGGSCSFVLSPRIADVAAKNNIFLSVYPSCFAEKFQPLRKCVFGPLQHMWEKKLSQFVSSVMGKSPGGLTKSKFTELIGSVWCEGMGAEEMVHGFMSTGIFPVDKTKFNWSLLS